MRDIKIYHSSIFTDKVNQLDRDIRVPVFFVSERI